jgi:hypothetical protein
MRFPIPDDNEEYNLVNLKFLVRDGERELSIGFDVEQGVLVVGHGNVVPPEWLLKAWNELGKLSREDRFMLSQCIEWRVWAKGPHTRCALCGSVVSVAHMEYFGGESGRY